MTPKYILRKSLCRPAHCADGVSTEARATYIEYMSFAPGYAEPGYTDPPKCVLFANWNYFPSDIDSILERAGYAIEWSDEWTTCDECGKAVRTSPDSYSWQPSYAMDDNGATCHECLAGSAGEYLESLEDNPGQALNIPEIDPAEYGYVKIEGGFESGFHPGQNDDPKKIYASLKDKYSRILFQIDEQSQFYIGFAVWYHPEENA